LISRPTTKKNRAMAASYSGVMLLAVCREAWSAALLAVDQESH
jgi:hypothetical protein